MKSLSVQPSVLLISLLFPLTVQAQVTPAGAERISKIPGWQILILVSTVIMLLVAVSFILYLIYEISQVRRELQVSRKSTAQNAQGEEITADTISRLQTSIERIAQRLDDFPTMELIHRELDSLINLFKSQSVAGTEAELAGIADQLEKLSRSFNSQLQELKLSIDGNVEAMRTTMPPFPLGDRSGQAKAASGIVTADLPPLWPATFSKGGPLAESRRAIQSGIAMEDLYATSLFIAIADVFISLRRPDSPRKTLAKKIHLLSRSLHEWAYSLQNKQESLPEPLSIWCETYQACINESFPSFSIITVHPGSPFDPDIMVRDEAHSGSNPLVKSALSWAIVDDIDGQQRVLQRAIVITR